MAAPIFAKSKVDTLVILLNFPMNATYVETLSEKQQKYAMTEIKEHAMQIARVWLEPKHLYAVTGKWLLEKPVMTVQMMGKDVIVIVKDE